MMQRKEMQVSAIKNGTVIDHIFPKYLFQTISILILYQIKNATTFGNYLESNILGKKAIIKIEDKYFEEHEISKIALITPNAKPNIIKNYQVIEKKVLKIPNHITDIVKCMNPKCITNVESVKTKFIVILKIPLELKCSYCEKITDKENMEII